MPEYQRKPLKVEAVRWTGREATPEVVALVSQMSMEAVVRTSSQQALHIEGRYTGTRVGVGDWVVLDNSHGLSVYPHATFIAEFEVPDEVTDGKK